jgi:hypothetical protein
MQRCPKVAYLSVLAVDALPRGSRLFQRLAGFSPPQCAARTHRSESFGYKFSQHR